ncbi:hypothetical protein D5085_17810 [Ectothiorhodospiraceae bacterium BW-2]|nr:hypothetical protein D5085_17810 [Ectothiorhodospiraceae bacterium BW-2]
MTPFSILGLDESIDDDEQIKLAYLTKTRQFPPDHAPEAFQRIRQAYETIATAKQRRHYQLFYCAPCQPKEVIAQLNQQQRNPFERPDEAALRQALLTAATTLSSATTQEA